MTIAFRLATKADADRQFIVATWSSSYKKAHTAGIIQADDWAGIMHAQIPKILARPGMRAVIAVDKADPDYFYGWIAGDTSDVVPVVAYIYVKEPYRRQGIARGLFAALGVDPSKRFIYPCKTGIVAELSSKIPLARFNNNEVRYPKESRRNPL
jgi:hypothetical protein